MIFSKLVKHFFGTQEKPTINPKVKFESSEALLFNALNKANSSAQAYRYASEIANKSLDLDKKIKALKRVLDICEKEYSSTRIANPKLNLIMNWAYANLADVWMQKTVEEEDVAIKKEQTSKALMYYNLAYSYAKTNADKIKILRKMAVIYQAIGEEEKWWKSMENVAALTPDDTKKNVYEELAHLSPTSERKKKYLDMALQYVMNENTSVFNKCQTTLQIAEELKQIYVKDGDYARLDRINMLIDKTALLLIDDLEQKILTEENREKKIEMEVKLLRFEQRYLKLSEEQHQQRIKHIYSLMKSGEKIRLKEDGQFLYKS